MAAGVGKTYRMLLEGRAELEAGRDVVIGLLETHGRAETGRLADGLAILPRRRVSYRETALEEMDLPAILRRAPELCLIDELAHTNAPGTEQPSVSRTSRMSSRPGSTCSRRSTSSTSSRSTTTSPSWAR
jgi:two-component system sensor histidine kinase KdpD